MDTINAFVGLDVHRDTIAVAIAEAGRGGEVRFYGTVPNCASSLSKLVRKLGAKHGRVEYVYEAGPCGYVVYRILMQLNVICRVVAPSQIPKRAADRIKNDHRDAVALARLFRAGELSFVWVPDEVHEAMRDLIRSRQAATRDVRQARQRIQSFLLKHGRQYDQKKWGVRHTKWLSNQSFDHPAQQIAFQIYINAQHQAVERRALLDAQIKELVAKWSLAPLVEALQTLRGVAFTIAVSIVAEIGDPARFTSARHMMAYVGLVPSEHSSGETTRARGITKAGNKIVRAHLIEAAWCYRLRAKVGTRLALQKGSSTIVAAIAWKAQVRLCERFRRMVARGKRKQVAVTAIARELVGFIWAICREVALSGNVQRAGEAAH